jgi:ribosomal protein S18 acetylase RimI-like enzyme
VAISPAAPAGAAPPVETLGPPVATAELPALVEILRDTVAGGASVGFLPPLSADEALAYWHTVIAALRDGSRRLLVVRDEGGRVVGTVQLDLATRPNGLHRAEVAKLMVHRAARRRGLGRALMLAAEAEARRLRRTTLVLDTRQGDPSELLYRSLGWTCAGTIPRYARSAGGALDTTAIYYRLLDPAAGPGPRE